MLCSMTSWLRHKTKYVHDRLVESIVSLLHTHGVCTKFGIKLIISWIPRIEVVGCYQFVYWWAWPDDGENEARNN